MPRLSPPRSKRVTVSETLPGEASLPDQDVVIELSEDDLAGIVIEAPVDPNPSPEPEPEPEPNLDDAVKRAVEAQQRAEEMVRTANRERDEAIRRERERQGELDRERGDRQDAEYNGVLTAIAAEQATLDRAEAEYAALLQAGEYTAAAKAQTVMAKASARIDRLEDNKATFDQRREVAKKDPPQPTQTAPAAPSVEEQIEALRLPDNAKTWLRNHPDLISDATQNSRLSAAHRYLTEIKNLPQFGQAYFDALETELGLKKPTASAAPAAPSPQQPQRRSMPVTAIVTRDVPTSSGERATSSQITLSPEEVRIAHTSFTDPTGKMTNADKERLYAMNKIKLQRARANGSYPNREQA